MPSNIEVIRAINAITDAVNVINISTTNLYRFNCILNDIDEFNNNKRRGDNQQAKQSLKSAIKRLLELLTDPMTALTMNCYNINRVVRVIRDLEVINDHIIDSMRYCKRFDALVSRNFSLSDSTSAKLEYLRYGNLYNNWNDVEINRIDAFHGFAMGNDINHDIPEDNIHSNTELEDTPLNVQNFDNNTSDDTDDNNQDLGFNLRSPLEYTFNGQRYQRSNQVFHISVPYSTHTAQSNDVISSRDNIITNTIDNNADAYNRILGVPSASNTFMRTRYRMTNNTRGGLADRTTSPVREPVTVNSLPSSIPNILPGMPPRSQDQALATVLSSLTNSVLTTTVNNTINDNSDQEIPELVSDDDNHNPQTTNTATSDEPDPINSFIAFTNTLNTILELNGIRPLRTPTAFNITSLIEPIKLKQSDIDLFSRNGTQCAICIDNFSIDESAVYLPCFHVFHEGCITYAFRNTTKCPLCNIDIMRLLGQ